MLLQTNMNSITMTALAQNGQKHLIFIVVPQVRMEMRKKYEND